MNIPGFTAEESLYKIGNAYRPTENDCGSSSDNDIVPQRRRAVCHLFDSEAFYLLTRIQTQIGGMICDR